MNFAKSRTRKFEKIPDQLRNSKIPSCKPHSGITDKIKKDGELESVDLFEFAHSVKQQSNEFDLTEAITLKSEHPVRGILITEDMTTLVYLTSRHLCLQKTRDFTSEPET